MLACVFSILLWLAELGFGDVRHATVAANAYLKVDSHYTVALLRAWSPSQSRVDECLTAAGLQPQGGWKTKCDATHDGQLRTVINGLRCPFDRDTPFTKPVTRMGRWLR